MADRFKYTAAQLFKIRMQYKAEFNNLRKTYNEIALEKPQPERKHFRNVPQTSIVPQYVRSRPKLNNQRRHYSPISHYQGVEKKSDKGKKQFGQKKSIDNLSKVLNQAYQIKQKSLSQALAKGNKSMINLGKSRANGLDLGSNEKLSTSIQKPCIKIAPKYHQYDKKFFG